MTTYDPLKFTSSLSAKLATRSKHVCMFLGAGASTASGLPDVSGLHDKVLADLEDTDANNFSRLIEGRNIEQVLTRLRRISTLISGNEKIDSFTADEAMKLDSNICQAIVRALDISNANIEPFQNLAAWAARANYRLPIELFTVNYDLLLENALESLGVPYFDGFVGNLKARFRTELVETMPGVDGESVPSLFVRLWKLHGSVNWVKNDDHGIIRIGHPAPEGQVSAIYPSDTKYEESRRVPFVVLQDRFRRALHHPETLLLVSGYSFGDAHINELIFDAATRRERSEFVVFCYSEIPTVLEKRAKHTPNLQVVSGQEAILGGLHGTWKKLDESKTHIWKDEQLVLRDFKYLATYLARSVVRDQEHISESDKDHDTNNDFAEVKMDGHE